MIDRYDVTIYWSPEDEVFIANVPELQGCMVHGDTRAEALASAEQAIAAWIANARKYGDPVPEPRARISVAA
jgi:predicted RNase H-like HicB family nuclease